MQLSPFALLDGLIAPAPATRRVAFLTIRPFAHRGLHGAVAAENSPAAFEAAIAAGHGIQCDVRASRDGEAIVFQDETLDRLTQESGPVADRTAVALAGLPLRGGGGAVMRLSELLTLVGGRVPILIELKAPGGQVAALCLAVRRVLEGYRGAVAVMSFNPLVARWFAEHAERITRGLVVSEETQRGFRGRAARHMALWRARPDFLAYDVRDLPSRFAARARARGVPILAWTVRDAAGERTAFAHADQILYEGAA